MDYEVYDEQEFNVTSKTFSLLKKKGKRMEEVTIQPFEYMLVCKREGREKPRIWITQPRFGFESPYPKTFKGTNPAVFRVI